MEMAKAVIHEAKLRECGAQLADSFTPVAAPRGKLGPVLHGAPRKYWSSYEDDFLRALAEEVKQGKKAKETWVIFDSAAQNHALGSALRLRELAGL